MKHYYTIVLNNEDVEDIQLWLSLADDDDTAMKQIQEVKDLTDEEFNDLMN